MSSWLFYILTLKNPKRIKPENPRNIKLPRKQKAQLLPVTGSAGSSPSRLPRGPGFQPALPAAGEPSNSQPAVPSSAFAQSRCSDFPVLIGASGHYCIIII